MEKAAIDLRQVQTNAGIEALGLETQCRGCGDAPVPGSPVDQTS